MNNKIFKISKLFLCILSICNASLQLTISPNNDNIVVNVTETLCSSSNTPSVKYLLYGDSGALNIEYLNNNIWNKTQSINTGSTRYFREMTMYKGNIISNLDYGSYIQIYNNYTQELFHTYDDATTIRMEVCDDRIFHITVVNRLIYTDDNKNFNYLPESTFSGTINNIACNPTTGVIIISGSSNAYRSTNNGTIFTQILTTQNTYTIKYLNDRFYALENVMSSIPGREYYRIVTSIDDGLTWNYLYTNSQITNEPLIDIEYSYSYDRLILLKRGFSSTTIYYASRSFDEISEFTFNGLLDKISLISIEGHNNFVIYTGTTLKNYELNPGYSIFNTSENGNRVSPIGYNGAISLMF